MTTDGGSMSCVPPPPHPPPHWQRAEEKWKCEHLGHKCVPCWTAVAQIPFASWAQDAHPLPFVLLQAATNWSKVVTQNFESSYRAFVIHDE